MSLQAAQLFVRCRSVEELRRAAPGAVVLHSGDWGTVVADPEAAMAAETGDARGEASELVDLGRSLSERFGTALAVLLDGGKLALSVHTFENGRPGDEERDPQPPAFRDVEQVAWDLLDYLGVPAPLRLLRPDALDVPRLAAPLAPAEPDEIVESAAGESRALEVRELPGGIPLASWAEALAAIEEAQSKRLLRALADGDGDRLPRPTFAYRSLQTRRVEKLMAAARQARPWLWKLVDPERDPPFSRAGYTRRCREQMTDLPVARAYGRHLEIRSGETTLRAPVAPFYESYLETLDDNSAALATHVRELISTLAHDADPLVHDGDRWFAHAAPPVERRHLLPTLLAGAAGERAVQPLAGNVHAALLSDDGLRIAPVRTRDLSVDVPRAFKDAIANVEALTERAPQGVRWLDLEHGRLVICEFDDPAAAGRILSPRFRNLLHAVLSTDGVLVATPTRDSLLACAADDTFGAAWLADESRTRFAEGPFPIDPRLWLLTPSTPPRQREHE